MARVSVVIPVYNEAARFASLWLALQTQTHPPDEIIFVDGGSTDGTPDLIAATVADARLANVRHADVRVLSAPQRSIPAALNTGIQAATGDIIVRLDGHSAPYPDYIERCLTVLTATGAQNVGGRWDIRPGAQTAEAHGIAAAVGSRLGAGDALYRLADTATATDTDTVPFGCFLRQTWQDLGGYNEALLTNEDYEFNYRIRQRGGRVHFDPSIRCVYYARSTLTTLRQQYWRYGRWKAEMLKANPASLRGRQALPILWSGGGPVLLLLAGTVVRRWPALAAALLLPWLVYLLALAISSRAAVGASRGWMILALLTIHFSWGAGAWYTLLFGSPRTA